MIEPTRHEVAAAAEVLLRHVNAIERRAADLLRQEEALQEAAQSTIDGALADALMAGAMALDAQRTSLHLDLAVAAAADAAPEWVAWCASPTWDDAKAAALAAAEAAAEAARATMRQRQAQAFRQLVTTGTLPEQEVQ